jgi:F420-non-reducing hydrogenase small subunit
MADKPKVAFYWCASCGGCEEAVVDLEEQILAVVDAVDIVLWPVAMDFKRHDIQAMPDKSIAVAFINGGVRMSEQEEWVQMLRQKAQLVVAFGACAHLGGIPGLANLNDRAQVFDTVYQDVPSQDNTARTVPGEHSKVDGHALELPRFWDEVKALNQVIDVDYYLPGCAPPPKLIWGAIEAILTGALPPKGAVLSPNKACCDDCPRKDSKPDKIELTEIKRPATHIADPELCFLAQGFVCMGPATRTGCGSPCIEGNMPCRGCMGPMDDVFDQGAKFLSAFASILAPKTEAEIDKLLDQIPDPVGTFYRFSLPTSLLHRRHTGATV